MSFHEHEAPASDAEHEESRAEPAHARRKLINALLGAAGAGVLVALGRKAPDPKITPDTAPSTPNAQGDAGETDTSTGAVAWVTWIGTSPNTTTNVNLRGLAGSSTLRFVVALGFWAEADGGGGIFEWDSGSGTDDGGTVIVYNHSAPTPGGSPVTGTGCWRRVYSGPIDVRWFGAVCNAYDGSPTDDTTALRLALAAIPPGGQLNISGPVGIGGSSGWGGILVSSRDGISIVGLNESCGFRVLAYPPTQQMLGAGPVQAFEFYNCARLQVRGLTFDANGLETALLGLADVTDSLIADCVIKNTYLVAGVPYLYTGLTSYSGTRNVYRGNRIQGCSNGVCIGLNSYPEVGSMFTENAITGCTGDTGLWIAAHDSVFNDNVITGNCHGINLMSGGTGETLTLCENVTIVGNAISHNNYCGIRNDPTTTTHSSRWVIANNVLDQNGASNATGLAGAAISLTYVDDLLIAGNHVTNYGSSQAGLAIYVGSATRVTISNNHTVDDRETPLHKAGIALDTVDTALVSGNVVRGIGGSYPNANAIVLSAATNAVVDGNSVSGCDIGVWVALAGRIRISNNRISGVSEYVRLGISIRGTSTPANDDDATNIVVHGNSIECDQGLYVLYASDLHLSDNVFKSASGSLDVNVTMRSGELLYSTGDQYVASSCNTYIVSVDGPRLRGSGSSAPSSFSWNVGDIFYNVSPASTQPIGWVCTTAGTPGTWKGFGTIL